MSAYSKSYNEYVGAKLSKLRKQQKLSQADLAEQLGISRQQLSKYEKGTDALKTSTLARLAEVLQQSYDYFLPDQGHSAMGLAAPTRASYGEVHPTLVDISRLSPAEQKDIQRKIAAAKAKKSPPAKS